MFEHPAKTVSLQDNTVQDLQDSTVHSTDLTQGNKKQSALARARSLRSKTPKDENHATHRQLVVLAHLVLHRHPREHDQGELMELVKLEAGRRKLRFTNSGEIARALTSAQWQRRHSRA
jgi:hypothetical protein